MKRQWAVIFAIWWISRLAPASAGLTAEPPLETPPVDSLLLRLSVASELLGYSGEYVHQTRHAGRELYLKYFIQHWPPDKTVIRFLEPDSLRQTVIAMNGSRVRARGDQHVRRMARHLRPGRWLRKRFAFREIDLLKRNYAVSVEPGPVMLDRPTYRVHIQPTRAGRPELRLWVDQISFFILKMQRLSPVASGSELHEYTRIEFTTPDTAEFRRIWASLDTVADARSHRKERSRRIYTRLVDALAEHDGAILVPQQVPEGFELTRIRKFTARERTYMHFLYTDGLAFISLFEYPKTMSKENGARQTRKRRQTDLSVVNGRVGDIGYHLVSEIPRDELERMAQSLMPIQRVKKQSIPPYYWWASLAVVAALLFWWQRRRERK